MSLLLRITAVIIRKLDVHLPAITWRTPEGVVHSVPPLQFSVHDRVKYMKYGTWNRPPNLCLLFILCTCVLCCTTLARSVCNLTGTGNFDGVPGSNSPWHCATSRKSRLYLKPQHKEDFKTFIHFFFVNERPLSFSKKIGLCTIWIFRVDCS